MNIFKFPSLHEQLRNDSCCTRTDPFSKKDYFFISIALSVVRDSLKHFLLNLFSHYFNLFIRKITDTKTPSCHTVFWRLSGFEFQQLYGSTSVYHGSSERQYDSRACFTTFFRIQNWWVTFTKVQHSVSRGRLDSHVACHPKYYSYIHPAPDVNSIPNITDTPDFSLYKFSFFEFSLYNFFLCKIVLVRIFVCAKSSTWHDTISSRGWHQLLNIWANRLITQ